MKEEKTINLKRIKKEKCKKKGNQILKKKKDMKKQKKKSKKIQIK